jgi:hypothetical protein
MQPMQRQGDQHPARLALRPAKRLSTTPDATTAALTRRQRPFPPHSGRKRAMQFSNFIVKNGTATILLAEDPQLGRVRFEISESILTARLGVEFPSSDQAIMKRCEEERQRIESACERAFQRAPSERVSMMGADFNDTTLESPPQPPTDVAGG